MLPSMHTLACALNICLKCNWLHLSAHLTFLDWKMHGTYTALSEACISIQDNMFEVYVDTLKWQEATHQDWITLQPQLNIKATASPSSCKGMKST